MDKEIDQIWTKVLRKSTPLLKAFDINDFSRISEAYDLDFPYFSAALRLNLLLEIVTDKTDASWAKLQDMDVLDIAAGSIANSQQFHPYFARLCAVNGARVVTIDLEEQGEFDQTLFTGVQADLIPLVMEKKFTQVPKIQGKSFDIIHSNGFVGFIWDPELEESLTKKGIPHRKFIELLFQQCSDLTKEGGVVTFGDINGATPVVYKKVNGILETVLGV